MPHPLPTTNPSAKGRTDDLSTPGQETAPPAAPPGPLAPELNRVPVNAEHIHLMGIGGTGMAALAGMLQEAGFTISGSDQKVYPPMSDYLAALEIKVQEGYSPHNLEPEPQLVVVGNVIRADNPEALALARKAIPYLSFPQALNHYFLQNRRSLVVAGTHGKTTTSSLLATMLDEVGLEPGFMIGGIVQAFQRSSRRGRGEYFVCEGDEYDTAFFDKGPKFLHYKPEICILTSVEFDHADIYADFAAVKASFAELIRIIPENGLLIACQDDPVVAELCRQARCPVVSYGEEKKSIWRVGKIDVSPGATSFYVEKNFRRYGSFTSRMPGRHNALNALAVVALMDHLGVAREKIASALYNFAGVRRRQEVRGEVRGITVIDDFAHHPTAVRETLNALRAAYPGRRLLAVFEPRTNSSRRRVFQQAYVTSFDAADRVLIREPEGLEAVPFEERFSVRQLTDDLGERGKEARAFADPTEIIEELKESTRPGDVVAILSNGGFDDIHQRLLQALGCKQG